MKLLAIDGNSIINRAFYGIKLLTTKQGEFTNGIYGFMNVLLRLAELEKPDGIAIAFDLRAKTFRHKMYDEYKAGRKGMPQELASQMPLLKELLTYLGYTCLSLEGYEADDILGTLADMAEKNDDYTCVIATGDRDSLQLVSQHTRVLLSATKMGKPEITDCTPDYIKEKYGVDPLGMIEIKALQGDASDNIPGVAGVGEKTAASLIGQYGNIDNIYENIDSLDIKDSLKAKLIAGKDSAYLSKKLGTICREVPLGLEFSSLKKGVGEPEKAVALLRRLEMFSLIGKLGLEGVTTPTTTESAQSPAPCTAENCSFDAFLTIAEKADKVYGFYDNGFCFLAEGTYTFCEDLGLAKKVLALKNKKYLFDSKTFWHKTDCKDINGLCFDPMLAAYLINPNAKDYTISRLCEEYVGGGYDTPEKLSSAMPILCTKLEGILAESGMSELLETIELPLARVLAGMESVGFLVDIKGIDKYGAELQSRIAKLHDSIIADVGYEFNINSPKQLGVALFEDMGLPCKKKTKSGYSTNAEVLEELRFISPTVEKLLEYRTLTKLKATYCDGLKNAVCEDGRIRSTLNQTETRTGRISSAEPNLQNIPVRKAEGRKLREFFVAEKGNVLCDADYSQIELRVLAHMADDENMIAAFNSGADIHTSTAAEVFGMPEEFVTPQMRSSAKAVNFGIVYGIGAFSLAKDIGVSRSEADRYIKNYLATYKGVDGFMKSAIEGAKETGYVTTMFSRRRPLPEIRSSNGMMRAFGERAARNAPIQGSAADIIKIAMIKVFERLEKELPEAKLIMQVHDELIVEAPADKKDAACRIIKEEMENAAALKVSLVADVSSGKNWLEAKG
ncbi:MAG: DNA polymerase I [Clostridia bacterium]|nr:DNA polymerase I [Clostridia bacterium]